jgi:hypothetical protein
MHQGGLTNDFGRPSIFGKPTDVSVPGAMVASRGLDRSVALNEPLKEGQRRAASLDWMGRRIAFAASSYHPRRKCPIPNAWRRINASRSIGPSDESVGTQPTCLFGDHCRKLVRQIRSLFYYYRWRSEDEITRVDRPRFESSPDREAFRRCSKPATRRRLSLSETIVEIIGE